MENNGVDRKFEKKKSFVQDATPHTLLDLIRWIQSI